MESSCLRHTDIPHTSRLFSDFQYHFDRVARFYEHNPMDPEAYRAAADQIRFPMERRAALVSALRGANPDSPALEKLAREGTVAVVTGQQVGLFSGPVYTIYKALTAVRLAERLDQQGIAAVPVFWLATEDHDLAEVNHSVVFDEASRPVTLRADGVSESQQPVGTIPLKNAPIAELRRALARLPFGSEVAEAVEQTYTPGATYGQAFHALLRRLLSKWGLLFIDPLDPAVRQIAAPLLARALDQAPELKQALLDRNKELEGAGYHAQVHIESQTSLFFLLEGNRRLTLRPQNGEYASKERTYSIQELTGRAAHLSPNALLRPVMQDYILPTVAYVGGPAELAYLGQSHVLYEALLQRMPVAVARAGFTLLDRHSAKLIDRYELPVKDLLRDKTAVRETIAARLVPHDLTARFESARTSIEQSLDHLRGAVTGFDPTLAAALDKSRSKIIYQLLKIEQKTARETLRRDSRAADDARLLTDLVYPDKHLQERLYSILPFLARHGNGLLDTLYENVHLECPDHKILVV